jgi:hypothetical protein
MKCITQPIIWVDSNQVSGEKIEFKIHDGIIHKMYVERNAIIINPKDSVHFDQVKGDIINGFFEENQMYLMKVNGEGKVIYYSKDEKDSLVTELNEISCEKMDIYLNDNEINRINFMSSPNGITEAVKANDLGRFLDNFYVFPKRSYLEKYNEAKGESLNGK